MTWVEVSFRQSLKSSEISHVAEKVSLLAAISQSMKHDRSSSRGLAPDGHTARVAAEFRDMFLNPLQSTSLVQEAGIQLTIGLDVFRCQEAECAEPVLNLNGDEIIIVGVHQYAWVIHSPEDPIAASVWKRKVCQC